MMRLLIYTMVTSLCLGGIILVPETSLTPLSDPYSGVLVVEVVDGQGSCFVVARDPAWWYAITAAHVVQIPPWADANWVSDIQVDEAGYTAEIVRIDTVADVALIRFTSPEKYKIYSFAKTTVEAPCTAIGYSRGSRLVYKSHIVSLDMEGFIVANGGVVPGCSGGVLLDTNGRAVGITVQVAAYYGWAFDSTAFYVPARFAEAMLVAEGIK